MTATVAENHSRGIVLRAFPALSPEESRRKDAARHRVARARRQTRRSGGIVLELHLTGANLYALRQLGLVAEDERDPETVAAAVNYFLQSTAFELASVLRRFTPDDERSPAA
jgi:hypothetical protein